MTGRAGRAVRTEPLPWAQGPGRWCLPTGVMAGRCKAMSHAELSMHSWPLRGQRGTCGRGGPTVCAVLHWFMWGRGHRGFWDPWGPQH